MTKININRNIYAYGIFYDTSMVKVPKKEHNWTGIIVYVNPILETERKICSLEGFFYSRLPILSMDNETSIVGNPLVKREEMGKFEEKYKGQFIPFDEK
jgi:hypothetical protein